MRINLPVTNIQTVVDPDTMLVSTTDTKGHITYCNEAFIQVSGFTKEELMGKAHNIVRHPDMPAAAYDDMWNTISAGKPWSAPVKNRRKDGGFYWVMANVMPLKDGPTITGYVSVRTHVTAQQIEQATALYETMNQYKDNPSQSPVQVIGAQVVHKKQGVAKWWQQLDQSLPDGFSFVMALLLGYMVVESQLEGIWEQMGWWSLIPRIVMNMAVALVLGRWFAKRLHVRVSDLVQRSNDLAAGDLTKIKPADQVGIFASAQSALRQVGINVRALVQDTQR